MGGRINCHPLRSFEPISRRLTQLVHAGLSPRFTIFHQLYREAATNALAAADEEDRLSYCSQLYRYDRFLQANSYIGREPTPQRKELEDNLLQLKRHEYLCPLWGLLGQRITVVRREETARMVKTPNNDGNIGRRSTKRGGRKGKCLRNSEKRRIAVRSPPF